ncbi:hypothetical protein BB559_000003 [Furculomyces boomerangus]|uniref:HIT domain-containing protein n=2 Tax=Harpellales TaxID=61421 RepID=A0A2T9Z6S2_9FUNG|nr:hypothetical protein BB559_000003 [Furculomyces boomerangus]PVZ99380.1 hypothetical protein BB558_004613 [Smittium angustum]
MNHLIADCLFCKIIKGVIPSKKIFENEFSFVFLDIGPLSKGHSLIIPKYHAQKMHEIPDEYLADILPTAKKIANAIGCTDYNILQNNGKIAHQEVMHVHFHLIPKTASEGLGMSWHSQTPSMDELQQLAEEISKKI